MKKWIIFIILILLVSGFLYYRKLNEPKDEYITFTVKKGDLVQSVEATGEVFAENLVDVGAQVSGQIKKLYVKVGDRVKKGDKIAQIDSIKQQNNLDIQLSALDILNAKLNSAKISSIIARTQYERESKLFEQNATSESSLENFMNDLSLKNANLEDLKAQIRQTEIQINTAKTDLEYTDIRSPLDGVIVSVPVEIGQTINANQTTPTIVNIADLKKMEIKMEISEGDIGHVKVGDKVEYSILSNIDKKYIGYLSSIDPGLTTLSDGKYTTQTSLTNSTSSNSAIYYYAKLKVNNENNLLRIGMTTQNTIIIRDLKNILILPTSAIKSDQNGNYVLVKKDDKIEQVRIKVGISSSINTQIVSGLNEGDIVINSQLNKDELKKILKAKKPRVSI